MFNGHDLWITAAGETGWASRKMLKAIFHFAFDTMPCNRVSTAIAATNKTALDFAQRLGFQLEGQMRGAWPDGSDAMLYGMLKDECPWLPNQYNGVLQ
jgi:RimJ/RimL family protein N-acetyltransferase